MKAKMKCTYCLVDNILLLEGVFPPLFAILEDRELFQPFQTENFCKLVAIRRECCDLWLANTLWRQRRKNNTSDTCDNDLD